MQLRDVWKIIVLGVLALPLLSPPEVTAQRIPRPVPGPVPADARTVLPPSRVSFLSIGHQRLDLQQLNERLETFGYPAFSDGVVTVGVGGHRLIQHVLFGYEAHALVSPSETAADHTLRTNLAGGHATVNVGYAVAATPRFQLTPMIGVGAGALSVEISERSLPSFDDVLRQPRRSSRMTAGMLVIDPGVGLNVRLTRSPLPTGVGGLAAGVRAGYAVSPLTGEWRLGESSDVAAGPDVGIEGPYVRVTIGRWRQGARAR